jgi:ketosteroid isomerase-like protein
MATVSNGQRSWASEIRTIVDGNSAAVEWHYEDTEKATGKRSQTDDAIFIEVKNGRISYWREYFDAISK